MQTFSRHTTGLDISRLEILVLNSSKKALSAKLGNVPSYPLSALNKPFKSLAIFSSRSFLTMILVTVGTEQYPFNALMEWIDVFIRYEIIDPTEEVVIQYGSSSKLPDRVKIFKRLPESKFKALLEQARLVISHCGEGSVMSLESLGKPYVLVPRAQCFGEHVDNHQLEMADALEKHGISIARTPGDLVRFLVSPNASGAVSPKEDKLCDFLSAQYDCNEHKKIMVVCSSGGHFKYAQSLKPFLERFQSTCWVTFKKPDTESQLKSDREQIYWANSPTNRNLPNLVRNLLLAFKVLKDEQPDIVISTGAGVAVPFLLLAKFFYKKQTLFIESKTRFKKLSLSARILSLLGSLDQLIVRSQELKKGSSTQYVGMNEGEINAIKESNQNSKITQLDETIFLKTPKHLGILEVEQFKRDFQSLCDLKPKNIVLDMNLTEFISSAGLGVLVNSLKKATSLNIQLILWSINQQVMSVFEMSRLHHVFTIEDETLTVRPQTVKAPKQKLNVDYEVPNPVQRTIDITVAVLGLFLVAIMLIPVGISIKLDSPGPIFSIQIRYGLMGKHFRIRKFRTVIEESVTGNKSSERITRIGHFLRKTNLDKLPLFWNLLKGELTLVGPRGSTFDEIDFYSTAEWKALKVKPGLTGECQEQENCRAAEMSNFFIAPSQDKSQGASPVKISKTYHYSSERAGHLDHQSFNNQKS